MPRNVIARKNHGCWSCGKPIKKREICLQKTVVAGGKIRGTSFFHVKCYVDYQTTMLELKTKSWASDPVMTKTVEQRVGRDFPSPRRAQEEEASINEEEDGYNCEICGKWMPEKDATFCSSCEDPLCNNCGPVSICPKCAR